MRPADAIKPDTLNAALEAEVEPKDFYQWVMERLDDEYDERWLTRAEELQMEAAEALYDDWWREDEAEARAMALPCGWQWSWR